MSAMQRNKGASGEREIAAILRAKFKLDINRNWMGQAAEGGADLHGLVGWAPEVKRAKKAHIATWWEQTIEQANRSGRKPILFYRLDYGAWHAVVRLLNIGVLSNSIESTATLSLESLFSITDIFRDSLDGDRKK